MSKIIVWCLIAIIAFAEDLSFWDYVDTYKLKKDEVAKVIVDKGHEYTKESDGVFIFRWTLFINKGLVTLVNYEGFPTQHVLYRDRHRQAVKFQLLEDDALPVNRTYLMLIFSDFDEKKQIATLDVRVKDPKRRVRVEFTRPEKEKGK